MIETILCILGLIISLVIVIAVLVAIWLWIAGTICMGDSVRPGVITFMPEPTPTPINLVSGATYEVKEFVADNGGSPTGDALNGIVGTINSGNGVVLIDNDASDNLTKVDCVGPPGPDITTVTFDAVDGDGHKVRAIADITLVSDGSDVPIGGVLVWTRVD